MSHSEGTSSIGPSPIIDKPRQHAASQPDLMSGKEAVLSERRNLSDGANISIAEGCAGYIPSTGEVVGEESYGVGMGGSNYVTFLQSSSRTQCTVNTDVTPPLHATPHSDVLRSFASHSSTGIGIVQQRAHWITPSLSSVTAPADVVPTTTARTASTKIITNNVTPPMSMMTSRSMTAELSGVMNSQVAGLNMGALRTVSGERYLYTSRRQGQNTSQSLTRHSALGTTQESNARTTHREIVDQRNMIIGEKVIEHEIRRPKKLIVEEVIEKTVIVPEKRIREELSEEVDRVYEKIVEVAKPVIQEKIIEVPEYEYVDKIVEVPEIIVQEKVREVPRVEIQERIIEIPRIIQQEKVVEIPEIEYREIPIEKIVEVPEIHEQLVTKEIPIPQYVDKPVPEYVTVEESIEIERRVPVPVEEITTVEFHLPQIRPQWKSVDVPVYIPRFVEIPVPEELFLEEDTIIMAHKYCEQVQQTCMQTIGSLTDLENLAAAIKTAKFSHSVGVDICEGILRNIQKGRLEVVRTADVSIIQNKSLMKISGMDARAAQSIRTTGVHKMVENSLLEGERRHTAALFMSATPLSAVQ